MLRFFVRIEMIIEVCDLKALEIIADKIGVVAAC